MASGNGARIVPPAVPMTITQIAVVVADMGIRVCAPIRRTSAGARGACSTTSRRCCTTPWSAAGLRVPHDRAETMVDGLGFELIQRSAGEHLPGVPRHARRGRAAHRVHEALAGRQRGAEEALERTRRGDLDGRPIGASIEFYYVDSGR